MFSGQPGYSGFDHLHQVKWDVYGSVAKKEIHPNAIVAARTGVIGSWIG